MYLQQGVRGDGEHDIQHVPRDFQRKIVDTTAYSLPEGPDEREVGVYVAIGRYPEATSANARHVLD